jgi:hypothetical protein
MASVLTGTGINEARPSENRYRTRTAQETAFGNGTLLGGNVKGQDLPKMALFCRKSIIRIALFKPYLTIREPHPYGKNHRT